MVVGRGWDDCGGTSLGRWGWDEVVMMMVGRGWTIMLGRNWDDMVVGRGWDDCGGTRLGRW